MTGKGFCYVMNDLITDVLDFGFCTRIFCLSQSPALALLVFGCL